MTSSPMIRSGNSGGILRVLRSYKSYLFAVLFLYLIVILVFHAQLHVYDGTGIAAKARFVEYSSSLVNGNRSSHLKPPTSYTTPARNTTTTMPFSSPKIQDQTRMKGDQSSYHRAFPLLTDCFPTSSANTNARKSGLSFQRIGEHYLYSAYFDDRLPDELPSIRVIALLKKSDDFQFFCHIPIATEEEDLTDAESVSVGIDPNAISRNGFQGTGESSDVQVRFQENEGNHYDEQYLKLRYANLVREDDSDNKAESHKENQNAPSFVMRWSNTRIDRQRSLTPESIRDYRRSKDQSRGASLKRHRPFGNNPRLEYLTVRASVYEMCENHNKNFGGWILSCPLDHRQIKQPPCDVLVSMSRQPNASAVSIPVFRIGNTDETDRKENFGICVPPLFGHIPSTTLVEFVEFSRILGANHFVFYHHQVSREIAKALAYYANRGTVTTIRWDLPVDDKAVWYHGQLLAINDCLYRSMHQFRHVAFNDIDEFVVPHVHRTWKDMVSSFRLSTLGTDRTHVRTVVTEKRQSSSDGLQRDRVASEARNQISGPIDRQLQVSQSSKGTRRGFQSDQNIHPVDDGSTRVPSLQGDGATDYAGYSFQSAFFDPLLSGLISHVMYDLESDLRTKSFSKVRSKVMVRPEAIFELGIHHVSRLVSEDLEVYHVPTDIAFVHHYRKCISEFDPLMSCQIFAHDESLSRFIPTIRHNIHQTLWCMKEEASLTDDAADKLLSHTVSTG